MAITKVASEYMDKQAAFSGAQWKLLKALGKGVVGAAAATPYVAYKGGGKVLGPAVKGSFKGIQRAGKLVGRHPHIGVPAAAALAYGAYKVPENLKKNYYHTDPRVNATEQAPLLEGGGIKYRSPQIKRYYGL